MDGILELHKWDKNKPEAKIDLSKFKEAFISPTKQLLLLWSYNSQAQLIPLIKQGKLEDCTGDDFPSSSGCEKADPSADSSPSFTFTGSNNNPFVWDVNTLAWGIYGDSYDQHEESSYRELLFVCGNHGVTVHAFRKLDSSFEIDNHTVTGETGEGRWTEWGPSTVPNCEDSDGSSLNFGDNESEKNADPKQWFKTFLTKTETTKSKGVVCTRYPEKLSYPSSATVVSFSLFDGTSPVPNFFPDSSVLSTSEGRNEPISVDASNTRKESGLSSPSKLHESSVDPNFLSCRMTHSYQCSKVFSSLCHHLIGFVLILSSDDEKISEIFILVTKIASCGIQWIFSVKLDESVNGGISVDWSDFGFSGNYLICLSKGGKVLFHDTMTGEYVGNVKIAQVCGLHHQSISKEQENMSNEGDVAVTSIDTRDKLGANGKTCLSGGSFSKRTFKRLLISSRTSVLAVIDEYGVIYVIPAADHLPAKYHTYEKQFPHYRHVGLGVLVGWEIGGVDISHERGLSNLDYNKAISIRSRSMLSSMDSVNTCIRAKLQDIFLKREGMYCDSYNGGFSVASTLTNDKFSSDKIPLWLTRKVFLPTQKASEDDFVCLSSFGVTRLIKAKGDGGSQILHSSLYVDSADNDNRSDHIRGWETVTREAIGCTFEGCFYLVTESGISVVLPSISVSSNILPVEVIEYPKSYITVTADHHFGDLFVTRDTKQPWSAWKVEFLDRVLLYEGPEEVDRLCLENGWDLEIPRIRRLQLALYYLHFDEVEKSLERLADVHLAEEGVLRLVFAVVFLMSRKHGSDSEVSAASRLLALATRFATKMIHKYGTYFFSSVSILQHQEEGPGSSKRLQEMSFFLEIVRKLQCRLSAKYKRPSHGVEGARALSLVDANSQPNNLEPPVTPAGAFSYERRNQKERSAVASDANLGNGLALMPMDPFSLKEYLDPATGLPVIVSDGHPSGRKSFPLENSKDMINRWQIDNLDLKTIVKDALHSGRLPLAVLQLHLHGARELATEKEPHDTFSDVRDAGRAIAYDLFLEGEVELAVATLHKLGEDIESSLKQLAFGTVRRSLRTQVAKELERYGYLDPLEQKTLDSITLIERAYPCNSFWNAFDERQRCMGVTSSGLEREVSVCLSYAHTFKGMTIECGDIDGVVLGSWVNVSEDLTARVSDGDDSHAAYWAAAAIWSDAWDQRTIDRVLLDQPLFTNVDLLWESQLEYHICHNNWVEVSKLLDAVPSYSSSDGMLQISLDGLHSGTGFDGELPVDCNYIGSVEEIDTVCMDIPNVQILRFSGISMSSMWLKTSMELQLASNFTFLKEFWVGTAEIIPLLARAGFISSLQKISVVDGSGECLLSTDVRSPRASNSGTSQALHKLVVHHCVQYNLPNLLDLYLDHHKLGLDKDSVSYFLEAAGDSQWAKWLLLSRVKGLEYDSSFCNARSIASCNIVPINNLSSVEIYDIIRTVDDLAEAAGEMTALATLIYAPLPIQDCLSSGTITTHSSSTSVQCTLENLRPALLRFPTLWRTVVAACFGQDTACNMLSPKPKMVIGNSDLSDYLNWRENVFFSSGRDTSLLQMLPCWFSKGVRRLIQLYMQDPLGWQSLAGLRTGEFPLQGTDLFFSCDEHSEISALSWEAAIQKYVEEEMYASSFEEKGLKLEHHLHRGRALAAFDHLLAVRVQKLKVDRTHKGQPGTSHVQTNVQADVQAFVAPITESEESLLSSVIPLAIMHFEDSVLVASCAFLLELCGLSASMLRTDITVLRRISSFYKSSDFADYHKQLSPRDSVLHAVLHDVDVTDSLARALADDYLYRDTPDAVKKKSYSNKNSNRKPSRALMLVLQHLETISLPLLSDRQTCGFWLLNGNGDGAELRSQQKIASQHWNLVTLFCQMHQIPPSLKYLAVLARDNDWVGFLSEAQVGGYSFETVVQVAAKEFSDPRLRIHILTVLKGIQSKKKVNASPVSATIEGSETFFMDEKTSIPVELFEILAECEKKKNPGESLLLKAKDMCWSILAMVASCFPDVSQLSCLTVWLEITAARETSSIKVNDIASQIATNVAIAVEATNSLPLSDKEVTWHYNRRNPKRRQMMDLKVRDSATSTGSQVFDTGAGKVIAPQQFQVEDGCKTQVAEHLSNCDEVPVSLAKMVAVLCEQHLFLPLLKAFEIFLPSCSLLPFIRALQAFSQMRLSEATAHLGSFSSRIREESIHVQPNLTKVQIGTAWISSTAVTAADAMLSTCPSPYEKRCLLQLLSATDFGDGGFAATYYRRLYWKINLAEPSLRVDDGIYLGNESLDDASLLTALKENGYWEQARSWSRQLEASDGPWKSASNHVTETQAEAMVAEWKEFLWDVPEERVALWGHCQTLFVRYSFPSLQAGLFFLKHAEAVEKDLPAKELQELLLLSLQWLSGMITYSNPVYPLHLLREIETRVWLLAVESEAQVKNDGDYNLASSTKQPGSGKSSSIIDRTDSIITKMDNHINKMRSRTSERNDAKEYGQTYPKLLQEDPSALNNAGGIAKAKRRAKGLALSRRPLNDSMEKTVDYDDGFIASRSRSDNHLQDDNSRIEPSFSRWEERIGPEELEKAVLSLLEFGQIAAAKELQFKLSPMHTPREFLLVDVALKLAEISTPNKEIYFRMLDDEVCSVIQSYNLLIGHHVVDPLQVLESLTTIFMEGSGRQLCKRIIAVAKAANVLGLSFSEAYDKKPIELLQLLSLKAQDSFDEAYLLVQTHSMSAASIAQVLAESFLKGLLAAHRGGYMDSQTEEGPAPLLWRFSDFLKWAELCPSEPEIGHALMRLVITGQEIPHACEVELLILSHHFYRSSACLDGVDVLVALAATRVEAYVSEGDFSCLARLITGVGNFHSLNFILGILIENGQLELLLQKFSAAADADTGTVETVRGFRIAVLTTLKQYNPNDLDAFAMVYNHFDMKHEMASLLESRADQSSQQWFLHYDRDQNEDLLDSMRYLIKAAEVYSSIDAGNKTHAACSRACLVSLQIRMPDFQWLNLSETNARRALVEQSRFQEALIVAEAYNLNQASEWALVLWNQMLKPELIEQFMAEFVSVLPLHPSMLADLARFYRAEVAARGDQSQFSVWLTGGGLPAEWAKYLGRSFRCLLRLSRDLRLRLQLATLATGFGDIINACTKALDKVPENAGPLVLRRGHGGAYLPLM